MLRKSDRLFLPLHYFPELVKAESTVVKKTQIKLFNTVTNILLTSAEKFIADKISDLSKDSYLLYASLTLGSTKGGQHSLPLTLPV